MKKIFFILFFSATLFFTVGNPTFAGGVGDPGSIVMKGEWTLGPEISGVGREISDRDSVRYDTESWRLLLKGSYGITDWLEVFGRVGGATIKIRGTPFDSNLGIAAGGGVKGTFLDPPGHPLRYSVGGQFLYIQAGDQGVTAKWFEYDIWLGASYKGMKNLIPYGGVVYSRVDGKVQDFLSKPTLDEFRSPTAAGIFFGITWPWSKKTNLGVEARVFSENSGTLSLMYRF